MSPEELTELSGRTPVSVYVQKTVGNPLCYTADKIEVVGNMAKLYWWTGWDYELVDVVPASSVSRG